MHAKMGKIGLGAFMDDAWGVEKTPSLGVQTAPELEDVGG